MASDEIVDRIADWPRHDPPEHREPPQAAHVAANPDGGGRANHHTFIGLLRSFHPHHGVGAADLRMAGADAAAGVAFERGETETVLPFVAQDELDACGAEAAVAVIQQERVITV